MVIMLEVVPVQDAEAIMLEVVPVQKAEAIMVVVVVPKEMVEDAGVDVEVDVEATELYHYHCINIIK